MCHPVFHLTQKWFEHHVQRISASQSLGFKDHVLEGSHGQSAATLVSYCPSRSLELEEVSIKKHSDRLAEIRCTGLTYLDGKNFLLT